MAQYVRLYKPEGAGNDTGRAQPDFARRTQRHRQIDFGAGISEEVPFMGDVEKKDIDKIFADGTLIDEALKKAAREAVRRHKRDGHPIVAWRDGHVVWIQPEDICVPDEPENASEAD